MPPSSPSSFAAQELDASVGASGPHAFAVRRIGALVSGAARVHRILSRVNDDLEPPLGQDVGEADLDRPTRLEASYAPAAWAKLQMLQTKYDPKGTFRNAQSLAASLKSAA